MSAPRTPRVLHSTVSGGVDAVIQMQIVSSFQRIITMEQIIKFLYACSPHSLHQDCHLRTTLRYSHLTVTTAPRTQASSLIRYSFGNMLPNLRRSPYPEFLSCLSALQSKQDDVVPHCLVRTRGQFGISKQFYIGVESSPEESKARCYYPQGSGCDLLLRLNLLNYYSP